MNCLHTGKPFLIETESVPSPRIVVLKDQVPQVKDALTSNYVPFIIDYEGYRSLGKIFCVVSFRPDADVEMIESSLSKA